MTPPALYGQPLPASAALLTLIPLSSPTLPLSPTWQAFTLAVPSAWNLLHPLLIGICLFCQPTPHLQDHKLLEDRQASVLFPAICPELRTVPGTWQRIHTCWENDMKEHNDAILESEDRKGLSEEMPFEQKPEWYELKKSSMWLSGELGFGQGPVNSFSSPLCFWIWQEINELADGDQNTTFIIYSFILRVFID